MADDLPREFLERLRAVTAKRAKTVIDHILAHGQITTEDLKDIYGYNHPPRAIKDVTDLGIPIKRSVAEHDKLVSLSEKSQNDLPEYVKAVLRKHLRK